MTGIPSGAVPVVWCTELDLADDSVSELVAPDDSFDSARVLVRLGGIPVDFVQRPLDAGRLAALEVIEALAPDAIERVRACAARVATAPGSSAEATIVVCTRDRPAQLRSCLRGLRALDDPRLEILVVDNAPSDDRTHVAFCAEVADDPRFKYVLEDRPGLSRARNRGLAEAAGDLVLFTDDDVRIDRHWVREMRAGFGRRADVACVTGLVCTASLGTAAEHYFDGKVSWSDRCEPRVYDRHTPGMDALYPYAAGLFGTGASMAFRAETLRSLGGFDEALGVGTPTGGGEDLDIFVRVIQGGYAIAYEPAAIVWHYHRSDVDGLSRQMFGYGSGLSAFITKHLWNRSTRRDLVRRIPGGVRRVFTLSRDSQKVVAAEALPSRALMLRELRGMAAGPVLYARSRRSVVPADVGVGVGVGGS